MAMPDDTYKDSEVESKSSEIEEILSTPPKALIKWGISVIFFILLSLLIGTNFIRYPEIISAKLTLTSYSPPMSIVARSAGRLTLFTDEGKLVSEGDHLGLIENSANSKDILALLEYFDKFNIGLYSGLNREQIQLPEDINAGELQFVYLSFLKNLKEYDLFKRLDYFDTQIKVINRQIDYNRELDVQLETQLGIALDELNLAKKRLKADSLLYKQGVTAELDFDKTKSSFLVTKKSYELAFQNITNNKIRRSELESKIGELMLTREEQISKFKNDISGSLKQLESGLRDWEQKYLLKAPQKGKVTFFKYRSNDQFINISEEVMRIVPEEDEMFGEVLTPVTGSGKVEIGQRVNVKLDNYPYHEYGMLIGRIETISSLPKENMYSIHVKLPNGLLTTYKRQLPYRQEMQGTAEIITKDLSLLQRVFNQFRTLIDKSKLYENTEQ